MLCSAGSPCDVVVDWGTADHFRVTVVEELAGEDTDPRLLLGALPEA